MGKAHCVQVMECFQAIPTYEMGPRNPFPCFERAREVYPYEVHGGEYRSARPDARKYKVLTLENKCLRVSVLPELGGRMHALIDKTNGNRNVLHTDKVKLTPGGIGRGYAGLGLEMNYPDAHSITNVRPRNYCILRGSDGSASVTIWEIEWIGRTHWSYSFTLYPDRAAVEVNVRVFNGTQWPRRMRYWANPATPSNDSTEFIFPEQHADMHGGGHGYFNWPVYLGMDLSKYRNHEDVLGLYYLMVRDGFFGYYNHKPGFGLVHAADRFEVPGKKLWTWGKSQMGRSRVTFYGGPYSEVQAGRLENQDHFDWVPPGKSFHWTEYWYPVKQMKGFCSANRELAAQALPEKNGNIRVQLHATRCHDAVEIRLRSAGRLLASKRARLDPRRTWEGVLVTRQRYRKGHDVTISVLDLKDGGTPLLRFTPFPQRVSKDEIVRVGASVTGNEAEKNPETLTLRANWFAREGKWRLTEKLLDAALARDPGYSPAHRQIGMLCMRRADFEGAKRHLRAALERNEFDPLALVWLGEIHLQESNLEEAERLFMVATRHSEELFGYDGSARVQMRRGMPARAVDLFRRALEYNTRNLRLPVRLAVAYRQLGYLEKAAAEVEAALRLDPTDPIARFEEVQLARTKIKRTATAKANALRDSITATLQEQYWLETAFFYLDLNCLDEAVEAARTGSRCTKTNGDGNPICRYLLGWLRAQRGENKVKVSSEYRRARACSLDFVWPSRLEEGVLLHRLMALNPRDGQLPYLLGNLCYAWGDERRGLALWQRAQKIGLRHAALERNLGYAFLHTIGDANKALVHYQRALKLRKDEVHLHVEMCAVLSKLKRHKAMCRHLEKHFEMTARSHTLAALLVGTYEALGQPKKVLHAQSLFHLEGWDYTQEGCRKNACVARAQEYLKDKRYDDAIAILEKAWELPPNLGAGEVTKNPAFARELYYMGIALEGAGKAEAARRKWEEAAAERHKALYRTIDDEFRLWFARYWQAQCLKKLGRLEEANTYLDGLIEFSKFIEHSKGKKVSAAKVRQLNRYAEDGRVKERRVLQATVGEAAEA